MLKLLTFTLPDVSYSNNGFNYWTSCSFSQSPHSDVGAAAGRFRFPHVTQFMLHWRDPRLQTKSLHVHYDTKPVMHCCVYLAEAATWYVDCLLCLETESKESILMTLSRDREKIWKKTGSVATERHKRYSERMHKVSVSWGHLKTNFQFWMASCVVHTAFFIPSCDWVWLVEWLLWVRFFCTE